MERTGSLPETITTLLFDLDGTLLDSRDFLVRASYQTMEKYFPGHCTYAYIVQHFGIGFSRFVPKENSERREQALAEFFSLKMAHYHERSTVLPGVKEGLQQLKQRGYHLGIVTNQHKPVTMNALQAFGMDDLFEVVIAIEDVQEGKPSPEGIEQALRLIGANAAEAVMIGDSEYDVAAGQRAGVSTVLLTWYEDAQAAEACEPDAACYNFEDLLCVLDS